MSQRVKVAAGDEIPPGSGVEIAVGDKVIAVFNVDGSFHAIDGICRHAGGPLAEGVLSGGVITCPWHGWQFHVDTGRHCLTDRIRQDCYPVTVENGDVYVTVEVEDDATE